MVMRTTFLSLFLLSIFIPESKCSVFEIKSVTGTNKLTNDEFSFPILSSGEKPKVAERINDIMQLSVLNLKIGREKESIFESIWPINDIHGVTGMSYTIYMNNDNIFSIGFYFATMGAYPDNSSHYFTFNAQNGELIELNNLFYPDGFHSFENIVKLKHKDIIYNNIKNLLSSYCENKSDNFNEEYVNELNNLLECCVTQKIDKYFVSEEGINIDYYDGSCLPHVAQAFDIDWHVIIPYNDLSNLTSEFGEKILSNSAQDIKNIITPKEKLFFTKGAIDGKYSISLFIDYCYFNKYDKEYDVSGNYWYDKVGKSIYLNGKTKDKSNFELYEKNENGDITGRFNIKYLNGKFSGTWTNVETSKQMEIQFE